MSYFKKWVKVALIATLGLLGVMAIGETKANADTTAYKYVLVGGDAQFKAPSGVSNPVGTNYISVNPQTVASSIQGNQISRYELGADTNKTGNAFVYNQSTGTIGLKASTDSETVLSAIAGNSLSIERMNYLQPNNQLKYNTVADAQQWTPMSSVAFIISGGVNDDNSLSVLKPSVGGTDEVSQSITNDYNVTLKDANGNVVTKPDKEGTYTVEFAFKPSSYDGYFSQLEYKKNADGYYYDTGDSDNGKITEVFVPGSVTAKFQVGSGSATSTTKPDTNNQSSSNQSSATSDQTSKPSTTNTNKETTVSNSRKVVYAIKPLYMYKNSNFKKSERIAMYANKPRVKRPMFVVLKTVKSATGNTRYYVRDVNHNGKYDNKRGYITARSNRVVGAYNRTTNKTITIINPTGVNKYRKISLQDKVGHLKQGTTLKVKGYITHNLTTRFVLSDGSYITGNKKLVLSGKLTQPKKVKLMTNAKLTSDVNLNHTKRILKKGTVLRVKNWDYSYGDNLNVSGTKRYAVTGGYISANSKYLKVVA
ncbi:DUF5776 domain-containing protein [Lentilactobacillus sp. Marseille-Q4993]|uniref:DUF5776 domain-containing protein n=1 Tax=Lentilactobacillus sp. Marseille-Q4993 TaxID=3039492 RepID=UPI0024BD0E8B|nr:DUF5776 domain-containing protein [Lentilactobacillus sp. Marseille-Q4993]